MQFPGQIVSEQRAEKIDLVADPGARRNIVELVVGFQFGEDPLLGPAAVMELKCIARTEAFVGDDSLEFVVVIVDDEQIELHGLLILSSGLGADEKQAPGHRPAVAFPGTPTSSCYSPDSSLRSGSSRHCSRLCRFRRTDDRFFDSMLSPHHNNI